MYRQGGFVRRFGTYCERINGLRAEDSQYMAHVNVTNTGKVAGAEVAQLVSADIGRRGVWVQVY